MTKDEIAREVAEKVMGWTVQDTKKLYYYEPAILISDWNPAERWDHAGMVVEKMKQLGWKFHLADGMFGMNYLCAFYRGSHSDSLQADTAQMAICLAALEAAKERLP